MNAPDDYNESDTQPRIILRKPFIKVVGLGGWGLMRTMYLNPYNPFIFYDGWISYKDNVSTIAKLICLGMVAVADGGFQLTADGRFYFHLDYTAFLERIERNAKREREIERRFPRDEWDEWETGNFDLLDFY